MISVLIIGGSRFVGKLVTQQLLKNSKIKLTLFNRGITNPEIIKGVDFIYGDRESKDIEQVYDKTWDVVIDMMGYYPNTIKNFVNKINTKRYIFISSISVYDVLNPEKSIINEQDKLLSECSINERVDNTWETYGNRKVSCEIEVLNAEIDSIILRPSLIYGPYDPTDRMYYWWYRIKNESSYIMPKSLIYPVTFTYAVDMASIIVQAIFIEKHKTIYNVVTHDKIPFYHFMEIAANVLNVENKIKIIDDEVIVNNGLTEKDIPLWFRDECLVFNNDRLKEDFKPSFTSISNSVKNSLDWYKEKKWGKPIVGMSIKSEKHNKPNYKN